MGNLSRLVSLIMLGLTLSVLEPRPLVREILWLRANAFTKEGRPYDHNAYPHAGAPGGPCDAVDDPNIREIVLQWGTRVGKTIWSLWTQQFWADTSPGPMLFVTADEKLAKEDIAEQYKMLEHNRRLAGQLRPAHLRKDDCVALRDCKIHVGWPRSFSTLAGKDIRYGHAAELPKWQHLSTSTEADPHDLFDQRFKNNPSYKRIKEGSPAVKGHCRIERLRLAGSNCSLVVPCTLCKRYQTLQLGDGSSPGGIRWEKLNNGRNDRDLARRSAHYVCRYCQGRLDDIHRSIMMRCGVWIPEGCEVDDAAAAAVTGLGNFIDAGGSDAGPVEQPYLSAEYSWRGWSKASWIRGTPVRDGRVWSSKLSSLYALQLGWGDLAEEFVAKKGSPQEFRGYVNGWLAETWELRARQQTWEQLGDRLIDATTPRGTIPAWASIATCGIDRQEEHYVWTVDAWGPDDRSHTVDYGTAATLDEVLARAILREFPHTDGGPTVRPCFTLIDSGYKPRGVCEFCLKQIRRRVPVRPSKGSSGSLKSDYERSVLGKNTAMPGMELIMIDTIRTQAWLDEQLHTHRRGDPGSASLFAGSLGEHRDFLEQLLNDAAVIEMDRTNNARESWRRIDETVPNDYRDCRRNGRVAMLLATRGRPVASRAATTAARNAAPARPAFTAPDGQPYLLTERKG